MLRGSTPRPDTHANEIEYTSRRHVGCLRMQTISFCSNRAVRLPQRRGFSARMAGVAKTVSTEPCNAPPRTRVGRASSRPTASDAEPTPRLADGSCRSPAAAAECRRNLTPLRVVDANRAVCLRALIMASFDGCRDEARPTFVSAIRSHRPRTPRLSRSRSRSCSRCRCLGPSRRGAHLPGAGETIEKAPTSNRP